MKIETLIIDGVGVLLGDGAEGRQSVAKSDVVLPPRTAMSCQGRTEADGNLKRGLYHITPGGVMEDSAEEITLCDSVVVPLRTVPLLLANTASRTIKIRQWEELGYACPVRIIEQIRVMDVSKRGSKSDESRINDEDIVVPNQLEIG